MTKLFIYTDGSCLGNPGKGGWGVIILKDNDIKLQEFGNYNSDTTNNQMELTAVIEGLKKIHQDISNDIEYVKNLEKIVIYTDSTYVSKGITEWIPNWQKRNWKTANNKPVKNVILWKELLLYTHELQNKNIKLTWQWVKAHNGNKYNEEVDQLARSFAENH